MEIRTLLGTLPDDASPTPDDWAGLSAGLKAEAESRIQQLNEALDDIARETNLCEVPV